jgi:hypothetical protein
MFHGECFTDIHRARRAKVLAIQIDEMVQKRNYEYVEYDISCGGQLLAEIGVAGVCRA